MNLKTLLWTMFIQSAKAARQPQIIWLRAVKDVIMKREAVIGWTG